MTASCLTTTDGVTLHVESHGEGRPVMFVAGYMASLGVWAWQVDAVIAAGYRAVCVDRRCHGRSERPAHGQRIARHAADIREVAAALELDRPLLVGGSMGASVCWSYLDLFGPDYASGMIGIDQTPRMVNDDDWSYGFYGLKKGNMGSFFDGGVPPTGRGRPPEASMDALSRLSARAGSEALLQAPAADTLPLLNDHTRQDWRDLCATTVVPQLIVAGRDSQLWPCEHAAAAVKGNPGARSAILEDCGHAANVDQPDGFNQLMIDFLRSTAP